MKKEVRLIFLPDFLAFPADGYYIVYLIHTYMKKLFTFGSSARQEVLRFAAERKALQEWIDSKGFVEEETLDQVAEKLKMKRQKLNALCEVEHGRKFLRFRADLRVAEAEDIIHLHPEYTTETLCMLCGYGDVRHFARDFQTRIGLTPAQYRAKVLEKR